MHSTNLFAKITSNLNFNSFIYLLIYKNEKLIVLNKQSSLSRCVQLYNIDSLQHIVS